MRRRLKLRYERALLLALSVPVLALVLAPPAWGHVTVHPSRVAAGSSDIELTFRVPNERDNANTVNVQVFFPTNLPLLTVDVLPIPGWSATVHTQNLARPVQTDDGPVSQIVSDVTWTARAGGIGSGQYEDFLIAAGSLPKQPGVLVFKALQTYSSGEVVRWIEVPVAGQPPPDNPAPVLTLTSGTAPAASNAAKTVPGSSGNATTAEVLAIAALVVSGLTLFGLLVTTRRSRRHEVSSSRSAERS